VRTHLGIGLVQRLRKLLTASKNLQVIRVYERDFEHALDLMVAQGDKRWSMTHRTSFVVMWELEVGNAFTFDRNFAEAGFRTLPEE